jgi:hypothetical protein
MNKIIHRLDYYSFPEEIIEITDSPTYQPTLFEQLIAEDYQ